MKKLSNSVLAWQCVNKFDSLSKSVGSFREYVYPAGAKIIFHLRKMRVCLQIQILDNTALYLINILSDQ